MTNVNDLLKKQALFSEEKGDYVDLEFFRVTERGITYKGALVININWQEGTCSTRGQYGCNPDDANFLRRVFRDLPSVLEKPKEVI